MRKTKFVLAAGFAAVLAAPTPADARPRLLRGLFAAPLAIIGGVVGARSARAKHHRNVHRPVEPQASARETRQAALDPRQPAPDAGAAGAGWTGPLFWPYASDDVFESAFGLDDDSQFWTRGFTDAIDGMFPPPLRASYDERGRRSGREASEPRARRAMCGSETTNGADALANRIREIVQPTATQQPAFNDLRSALTRAFDRIKSVCPAEPPVTGPARLNLMIARLTAARQAVTMVSAPGRAFYAALSDEQKARLEKATAGPARSADAAQARAGAPCAAPVEWPYGRIERTLRPTPEQRAGLEQLRLMSLHLANSVASTCPTTAAGTAPERLDAIRLRLSVLRYAALNVSSAYNRFYASLSVQQKARLHGGEPEQYATTRR
jgi:hypothetical protein